MALVTRHGKILHKSLLMPNEPETRYCGHHLSRLTRNWTYALLRVAFALYVGGGEHRYTIDHWPHTNPPTPKIQLNINSLGLHIDLALTKKVNCGKLTLKIY